MNHIEAFSRLVKCFNHELETAATNSGYFDMQLNEDAQKSIIKVSKKLNCSCSVAYIIQQPFYIELKEATGKFSIHPDKDLIDKSLLYVLQNVVDLSLKSASFLVDLLSIMLSKIDAAAVLSPEANNFRSLVGAVPLVAQQADHKQDSNEMIMQLTAQFPTIVDLFESHHSLFFEQTKDQEQPLLHLAEILILMQKLKPRLYSISSSNFVSPKKISITVGVVNIFTKAKKKKQGVCSNHLSRLQVGEYLNAKIVKSSFRLPPSNSFPIIMITAGTGLAPFMGFLGEREKEFMKQSGSGFGKCHLFFGCRSDNELTYMEHLQRWEKEGITKLHIAQNRGFDKPRKQVQNSIAECGEELADILLSEEKAHVYICGNAGMYENCREAFIDLLKKYGNMSKVKAIQMLASLHINNRWQLHIWGKVKETDIGISLNSTLLSDKLTVPQKNWISNF